jgi:hypothetical protein
LSVWCSEPSIAFERLAKLYGDAANALFLAPAPMRLI